VVDELRHSLPFGVRRARKDKTYDCSYSLCFDDLYVCLLDFGMVFLARVSGLQPVFQDSQSQTANLKIYASRHFYTSERFRRATWREWNHRKIAEGDKSENSNWLSG